MTQEHQHPFHWVRKIDAALLELDQVLLYGNAPRFDFQRISSLIASHFGITGLSLEMGECAWREPTELTEGLGPNLLTLGAALTPLSGEAIWLMSRQDVAYLTSWLMNGKARGRSVSSEILQEGFYRYLALNALDALQGLESLKDFSLKLDEEPSNPQGPSWTVDIKLTFEQRSCWGRLVVSKHLLTSWQRHFASLRELFSLTPLAKSLEISVGLKTGSVSLTAKEWKKLKKGDFVILDRGSYDPKHKAGVARLTLPGTPLFHVSVKENKIKLLDYALFYEDEMENRDSAPEMQENEIASAEIGEKNMIPADEGLSMAVKDLPLHVTVELARLRISVDQLMKLSPGNFLELPVHPEQGVTLTVNGQKVGRAELVYLGEKIGIRILETA
jgi:type III secretion system YscQ/HrcQ family protein